MRLPDCTEVIIMTMGVEMGLFLSVVSSSPANPDGNDGRLPVNQTYYTAVLGNGSRSAEEVKYNQNIVVAVHPPFSHANLRSDQNLVEQRTSTGRTQFVEHDGLERLKVPVFCAAVATFIFGVVLFVRKALHMDIRVEEYYHGSGQDNENVLVNGDDVMYIYDECGQCNTDAGYESTEFRCPELPSEMSEEYAEEERSEL